MRKRKNAFTLIALAMCFCIQAQEEDSTSKFNLILYGGIGFGIIDNDNEPNYNLNSNTGEIQLNYKITERVGLASGVSLNQLSGNGFNSLGNFYHERGLLKIPLLVTYNSEFSEKLRLFANIGFYGQVIVNDEYRFLDSVQKDVYEGWNFGMQLGVGLMFELYDGFSTGISFSGQSDFGTFESNTNQGINDEQKMKNLNSIGLIFMFDL